jgi:DMSO/TMAO reductase YedYZ molybdopterin-dependent catalytic subunit
MRSAETPDRRAFLRAAAALPLAGAVLGGRAFADKPAAGAQGLITRVKEPENLEFPFQSLDQFVTPAERFYVRNHFAMPKLDAASWRLKVEGAVERPLELSLDDLKKMTQSTQTATLECAGNSRVFLTPAVRGVPWELGAVGNAEWGGVPLAAVLDKAGVKSGAVEVVLEGADSGEIRDEPKSPGVIHFARSLPLDKARKPEVLLAHRMNGAELPASHGFPVRAVVAGWYGMASVKWLTRLVVTERPFAGYWQTFDYSYFERRDGSPQTTPVTAMRVKSAIARPAMREVVPAGRAYRVFGAAWAGESAVAKVEFSADGGATWAAAKLLDKAVPFAWRFWEYEWQAPAKPGRLTLMSRATDEKGRVQPDKHDPDRRNYMIHHTLPIDVEVR